MPYQDSLLRERVRAHGRREAERLESNRPETPAEAAQRQNPKVLDITSTSVLGLNLLETLTT